MCLMQIAAMQKYRYKTVGGDSRAMKISVTACDSIPPLSGLPQILSLVKPSTVVTVTCLTHCSRLRLPVTRLQVTSGLAL